MDPARFQQLPTVVKIARGLELLAEDDEQFGRVPDDVRAQVAEQWPA